MDHLDQARQLIHKHGQSDGTRRESRFAIEAAKGHALIAIAERLDTLATAAGLATALAAWPRATAHLTPAEAEAQAATMPDWTSGPDAMFDAVAELVRWAMGGYRAGL